MPPLPGHQPCSENRDLKMEKQALSSLLCRALFHVPRQWLQTTHPCYLKGLEVGGRNCAAGPRSRRGQGWFLPVAPGESGSCVLSPPSISKEQRGLLWSLSLPAPHIPSDSAPHRGLHDDRSPLGDPGQAPTSRSVIKSHAQSPSCPFCTDLGVGSGWASLGVLFWLLPARVSAQSQGSGRRGKALLTDAPWPRIAPGMTGCKAPLCPRVGTRHR